MLCTLGNSNIINIFTYGTCIISKALIPLLFTLATVLFIWGVVKFFIIDAGEEAKRSQGKQFMIWGLIALVVMSSVWGLVRLFGNTLGLNPYTRVLPGVRPPGSFPNNIRGGGTTSTIPSDTTSDTNTDTGPTTLPGDSPCNLPDNNTDSSDCQPY
jgi:hypothetical protein